MDTFFGEDVACIVLILLLRLFLEEIKTLIIDSNKLQVYRSRGGQFSLPKSGSHLCQSFLQKRKSQRRAWQAKGC